MFTTAWSPSVVITDKFVFRRDNERLSKLEKINNEYRDSLVSASVKISKFLYPITEFCNNLVEDVAQITLDLYKIKRMKMNFTIDKNGRLTFLWCDCIRVFDRKVKTSKLSGISDKGICKEGTRS